MKTNTQTNNESWHLPRLFIAWVVALVIALAVLFLAPIEKRFEWLVVGIGFTTLLSFVLQLGTAQREGFITRLSFSVIGSVLVIGAVELGALIFQ